MMRKLLVAAAAAIVAAAGTPAAYAQGSGTIRGAGGIPDSYIVVLKNRATAPQALAAKHGGKINRVYAAALRGFAVTMSSSAAARLAADPAVAYVQRDQVVKALDTQVNPPSWGLDRIDQNNLPLDAKYSYPNDNGPVASVTAYVLDTGVRHTHADFGGRATPGKDLVDNDDNADDCHGHGTHVAGTLAGSAYGVAKRATVTPVRVLNCQGSGSTATVIAGIDWIAAQPVPHAGAVTNISLGGSANDAVDEAVRKLTDLMPVAVAAGATGDACTTSPARVPAAITVGATDQADARATFSSTGPCLDLFAPGKDITSLWNTSDSATMTLSGTSMAAPHVAGSAALALTFTSPFTLPRTRITQLVVERATPGKVTNPGAGSPNRLAMSNWPCDWCAFAGAADWNGDGNLDLIAAEVESGDLWMYPGDGTHNYRTSGRFRIGTGFGGATFAGVAPWAGTLSVIYRVDGGPENGNLYAYGASRVLVGSGFGGATFAGLGDWDRNGATDVVYRVDSGAHNLYAYGAARVLIGSGFGGCTFAGVADWDGDTLVDVDYRIDQGPETGHLFAHDSTRTLIGTGFGGAQFADVANWDKTTAGPEVIYVGGNLADELWLNGAHLIDHGF